MKNQILIGGIRLCKVIKERKYMEEKKLKLMVGSFISLENTNYKIFLASQKCPLRFQ
jgi:hypothetical protein